MASVVEGWLWPICLFGFTYATESLDRERVTNAMVKLGALAESHSFFRFRQALDQTLEDIFGF